MEHVLNLDERVLKKLDQTIVAGVRGQLHYMYKKYEQAREFSNTTKSNIRNTPKRFLYILACLGIEINYITKFTTQIIWLE